MYDLLLKTFQTYCNIPEGEWLRFKPLLNSTSIKRRQTFCRVGEKTDTIGFVYAGILRKYHVLEDGSEFTHIFYEPGQLVASYSALIQNEPANCIIEALDDVQLITFPYREFIKLYDMHVCWERLGRRVAEVQFIERETREFQLLTMTATERFQHFCKRYPLLKDKISQKQIAAYVGVSPEALSRMNKKNT